MTALVQNIRRHAPSIDLPKISPKQQRLTATFVLLLSVAMVPESWHAVIEALSDAYLAVSIFVAGTLALVFTAERAFKTDLGLWLQKYQQWQVPVAALLGAFPGCGGAIIAITQYTRGYLSFGGVVATLTATMGDAMFLLLAREPQTAVGILGLSIVIGIISGYVIDKIHGRDFMRSTVKKATNLNHSSSENKNNSLNPLERFWIVLMIPGFFLGLLGAFQIDMDEWLRQWMDITPVFWLGVIGAVLVFAMWLENGGENSNKPCDNHTECKIKPSVSQTVIHSTNFVSAWVIFSFVAYEVIVASSGIDLALAFNIWAPLIPAIAVLIGLIPGCGPQILVTSLYVSGSVPLSAQMANAMANDGDALFPAIATAPKAAIMATIYSAIPALMLGYGWLIFME